MLWRRGLKTYKVRSLSGRAFAGTPARQQQYLEDMRVAYADAMARTGLAKTTSALNHNDGGHFRPLPVDGRGRP